MINLILPSVLPWIGLAIAAQNVPQSLLPPIWFGLFFYMLVYAWQFLRLLEPITWANVSLFAVLFMNRSLGLSGWLQENSVTFCYLVFGTAGMVSILVGKPFSGVYGRMQVPSEHWEHPLFKRTNLVISCVWVAVFAISAAVCAFASQSELLARVVCIALLIGAVIFTDRYPTHVKNRAMATSQTANG